MPSNSNKPAIKVLIVEDSSVVRDLLSFIIQSDKELQVIGYAESGEKAIDLLKHIHPDVITMDIVLPQMNGFETTKKILCIRPIPIIIVSSLYSPEQGAEESFKAFESGALAILEKPEGINSPKFKKQSTSLINTIKMMSEVKLITRSKSSLKTCKHIHKEENSVSPSTIRPKSCIIRAVAIGASLGGPQAIQTILGNLPATFSVPILIVQHISPGFVQGFVDWLQQSTKLRIKLADHQEEAQPGIVYVAPDDYHMQINPNNIISLMQSSADNGLRPSVSKLFESMALSHGPNGIGVILTGMGKDGVEELLLMKQKGGFTIAQNQSSCLIFGMPGEACHIGAAEAVLDIGEIAKTLQKLVPLQKKLTSSG